VEALWAENQAAYRQLRRRRLASDGTEGPSLTGVDEDGDEPDGTSDAWKDDLLERVKTLSPAGFERLCQRLLREAGVERVQVVGGAGDQGIDGGGAVRLALLSFPVYFQAKRYWGTVTPSAVRDFRGTMAGRGEKGLLITTGTFTPAAYQEATRDGVTPIDLIDGDELCELLKRLRVGVDVTERTVEDVSIDVAFLDTFE
jgi:restriction system protein